MKAANVAAPVAISGAVLAALIALYLIWGSTYLAIRFALEVFPPLLLAGLRFLCAGAVLFAVLLARGAVLPTRAQWRGAFVIGLLLGCANAAVCFGEQSVATGLSAVVIASVPIWVAFFATLFGDAPTRVESIGLAVGLCGVVVLNLGGELRASPAGAAVLVLSTLCWAAGSIWSRRVELPSGVMSSAAQLLCGGAALCCAGLLHGERLHPNHRALPLVAFAFLVVFGSIVGYSAYQYLLIKVRHALATSYAYVNPLVASALGVLVLHERLAPRAVAALLLILGGVALVSLPSRRTVEAVPREPS